MAAGSRETGTSVGESPGVRAAFDLLREELSEEEQAVRSGLAGAAVDQLDAIAARVKALHEIKQKLDALQTAYSALTVGRPPLEPPSGSPIRRRRLGASGQQQVSRSISQLTSTEIHNCPAAGGKPVLVAFPDRTGEPVRNWNDLPVAVCAWLSRRKGVPVPFAGRSRSRQWFVNVEPVHSDGSPFDRVARRFVRTDRQEFWIDTHRSAGDLLRCLEQLITACGESPAGVEVTYRPGRRTSRQQAESPAPQRAPNGPAHGPEAYSEAILATLREHPAGLPVRELLSCIEAQVKEWLNESDRSWMPNHQKQRWAYVTAWSLTELKRRGLVDNPKRGFWTLAGTRPKDGR